MTRDKLLENICPVKMVYDCCNSSCKDCNRVLNESLDEYDKHIMSNTSQIQELRTQ